jgi:hypothetical protein
MQSGISSVRKNGRVVVVGYAPSMAELELSERQIRPVARNQKRALLRKLNVRASELDPFAAVHVDLLARSLGRIVLLDEDYARRGQVVDAQGQPAPSLPIYVSLLNSARLTATKLAEHMNRKGTPAVSLRDYIDERYSVRDGEDG